MAQEKLGRCVLAVSRTSAGHRRLPADRRLGSAQDLRAIFLGRQSARRRIPQQNYFDSNLPERPPGLLAGVRP